MTSSSNHLLTKSIRLLVVNNSHVVRVVHYEFTSLLQFMRIVVLNQSEYSGYNI
jgi:hypothetical protein